MTRSRARIRLTPWSLRRRVKGWKEGDALGEIVGEAGDLGDDPVSAVIGLVLFAAFGVLVVVPFLLGIALLPLELLVLLLAGSGALLLQVVGLRPFTVAVEERVGGRWIAVGRVQRRGLRAARAERDAMRRELLAADARSVLGRRGVQAALPPPPPGWYEDPGGSGQVRFWDGTGWTEQLQPKG